MRPVLHYANWLHLRWPANVPEALPVVSEDGSTRVPGLWVVGDLAGVPLLKLSVNAGARVARRIAAELGPAREAEAGSVDLAIVGGGASGFAAAVEAARLGLSYVVLEASEPFSTIVNFPRGKPIFKYPTELALEGRLVFHDKSDVKEGLLADLREQTVDRGVRWLKGRASHVERVRGLLQVVCPEGIELPETARGGPLAVWEGRERLAARHVVVALGRSGNYRELGVPGEDLPKVSNRLHDPAEWSGQDVLVVGGGDSAVESAIALVDAGARVTLSYRGAELARPKPDNLAMLMRLAADPAARAAVVQPADARVTTSFGGWTPEGPARGSLRLELGTVVTAIHEREVELARGHGAAALMPNDGVFVMIGREAPLEFFRRSGVPITGERSWAWWLTLAAFLAGCIWLFHWKKPGVVIAGVAPFDRIARIGDLWAARGWFPYGVPSWWASLGEAYERPAHLLGTLRVSLGEPGFWYSLAYCLCVVVFGFDRMRRKRTPYVAWQTSVLMAIQCLPLFLLPYVLLPWMGNNGWFDAGAGQALADALFPRADYGHGREYWRAFGLILAWPLFIWNVFTEEPLAAWLAIGALQTFVLIPSLIFFWGKGVYCGWICSCGALAETLGDRHRRKMPHGSSSNALNLIGQAFLAFATVLAALRVAGWVAGSASWPHRTFRWLFQELPFLNYVWFVDLLWAGILGVGLYFWFSGRVWCRFACPLAALMHVYARFSRFRILADKKKCISCNVCTSVCHQGIDVMSFANKGLPMADPQCVRCSACVESCPTGVLAFGRVDAAGLAASEDPPWLAASPVRMREAAPAATRR
jgi:thioredoxin reductase/polyferredoxin